MSFQISTFIRKANTQFLVCISLTLLLAGFNLHTLMAHNGAIAYAYPIEGITTDGDLSDWPAGMMRYPIQLVGVGVPATSNSDLSANFRIGYNKDLKTIFIAVEVTDESNMMDTSTYVNWDTHDGVELFIDPDHLEIATSITQYSEYAKKRLIFGRNDSWKGVDLRMKLTETGRTYEWSIQLDRDLHPGLAIAMDLSVIDKDLDDSYSWVSWGQFTQKQTSVNRCGDLVLLDPGIQLVDVKGTVELPHLLSAPSSFPIRFSSQDYPGLQLRTVSDSAGAYTITLPSGAYQMDIPEQLMSIGNEFYQTAPNATLEFQASASSTKPPMLSPSLIAGPDLRPEVGILHNFDAEQIDLVDQFIETYREFYSIPGVSLALIKDGKVVYYKTYGIKSTRTNDPVTDETLFEAASITKPVFGFVVLRLAEQGIIDLDKPLYQYLPFDALEVTPEYKKMTARHVLIHQSGLPNWGVPLERSPGTQYGYSGEGFEYLKRVVCKITGKDIEQLLDEEVIGTLNLYHMEFKDSEELRKVAAIGHQGDSPTYWPIPTEPGMAHSLHTEANAFSRFAIALLEEKGLDPVTYQELAIIHTTSPEEYWDNPDYTEGAGLGVHVRKSPYGNVIGHGGNNGDFKCLFEVYQELNMGYVVFTNSSMGDQLAGDLSEFLVEGRGNVETLGTRE